MSNHEEGPPSPYGPGDESEINPPPVGPDFERARTEEEAAIEAGELAVEDTVETNLVDEAPREPSHSPPAAESTATDDPVTAYLKGIGAPPAAINEVKRLIKEDVKDLLLPLVYGLGFHGEKADKAVYILSQDEVSLRIDKLVANGLPDDEATKASIRELIVNNRDPIQRQTIYAKLADMGVLTLHPHTKEEVDQYHAVVEAISESDSELRRELLEKELMPKPMGNKKDYDAQKKAAKTQIDRLLHLPAGSSEQVLRVRLEALGFSNEHISKILKPINPGDKFEGLRRSHFGGWKEDGKYHFVYDPARIAERSHIPLEVLTAAAEKGISPEYLNQARSNEAAGQHLRSVGIDWGAEHEASEDDSKFIERSPEDLEAALKRASKVAGSEITESYIEMAKTEYRNGNLFPAEYLASIGLPIISERMEPPDPVILANKIGRDRTQAVADLTEEIEQNPGAVSRSLRRPASLPLPSFFYDNPAIRFLFTDRINSFWAPFGKRILAWRVARQELHDRPIEIEQLTAELKALKAKRNKDATDIANMQELEGRIPRFESRVKSDLGLLRLGLPLYREKHDNIDTLDESVNSHRRQLSLLQRHKLHDINTAVVNLSYRVFDARESLRILRDKKKINDHDDPYFIHNHERFKRQRSAYVRTYIQEQHEKTVGKS